MQPLMWGLALAIIWLRRYLSILFVLRPSTRNAKYIFFIKYLRAMHDEPYICLQARGLHFEKQSFTLRFEG